MNFLSRRNKQYGVIELIFSVEDLSYTYFDYKFINPFLLEGMLFFVADNKNNVSDFIYNSTFSLRVGDRYCLRDIPLLNFYRKVSHRFKDKLGDFTYRARRVRKILIEPMIYMPPDLVITGVIDSKESKLILGLDICKVMLIGKVFI